MNISAIGGNSYSAYASMTQSASANSSKSLDTFSSNLISQLDADGDGALSNTEASGLSQDTFQLVDADSDGLMTQDEIKSALQKQQQSMPAPPPEGAGGMDTAQAASDVSSKMIETLDTDGDGSLSSTELEGLSSENFSASDTNGDGVISADELSSAIQSEMDSGATGPGEAEEGSFQSVFQNSVDASGGPGAPPPPPPTEEEEDSSTESTTSTGSSNSLMQQLMSMYQESSGYSAANTSTLSLTA